MAQNILLKADGTPQGAGEFGYKINNNEIYVISKVNYTIYTHPPSPERLN
ncbi:MAG: hypothetical protein ACMUEM_03700 [Flavobacteriales bacterium AspAUS03]